MKYNIMRGLCVVLGIMVLMNISVCASIPSSFSFISPLNNSIITDNSFVLINVSAPGYSDVSYGSDSFSDDGSGYWSYGGYIPSEGLNVVSVDFCVSESSCTTGDLYFYVLPVSFINPIESSYANASFVLINVSAPGYSDVSYGSDSFSDDGSGYWSYGGYIPSEGLNVVSVDFCVSEGVCTSKSVSFYYDTVLPVVTVPANIISEATSSSGAVVSYSGVSSTEGSVSCNYASGSTFAIGINTIVCSATDLAGNLGSESFNITVKDTTNPNIYLVGGNVTLTVGDSYTDSGATANDTVSGNLTSIINVTSNVNSAVAGTYVVQYNVTDAAGNSAFVNRTVVVNAAPSNGGGNIGGGGGSYNPNWNSTRTVNNTNNIGNNTIANQTLPQTNVTNGTAPGFFSGITGAVIGTTAGKISLGVLIFLILIGLAWWIVAFRKKRAALAAKPIKKK
jgi:hypothetical protein